jgi:hypothetical protein
LTPWLERQLLGLGEELVRVSPKLTVPERRAGRTRGKSDPIDALALARAALREPDLPRPQPGERVLRELKLLVDHRDNRACAFVDRVLHMRTVVKVTASPASPPKNTQTPAARWVRIV